MKVRESVLSEKDGSAAGFGPGRRFLTPAVALPTPEAHVSISPLPEHQVSPPRRNGPGEAPAYTYAQAEQVEDRFWPKVFRRTAVECWTWTGSRLPTGYGWLRVSRGTNVYAHRVAYALANDGIAENMTIDHLCRNKSCVNPAHLEAVTMRENIQRRNAHKDRCPHDHVYDGKSFRRGGWVRTCSTCLRDARRRCDARRAARRSVVG